MAIDLGSAYGRIVIDTDQMQRSLSSAAGMMGRVNTASVLMGNLLTEGMFAAGRAVAGMIQTTIGGAADMEQQVANIAAVMGRTRDEVEPLQGLIEDLGINPNLKVTAVEAGQAIEMLARNGLAMDEILQGAAESTVLLANATGGQFGDSADIMTDAMSLFGIEANATMDAVNGITSVVTNSKFTINDYALALAQGGGVASTVGVEFDDFNTTIAAISPLFKSGSDAGTSFKTFLQRLAPTSNTAQDAMAELGLITEDNRNLFFDLEGNMLSMAEISTVLANATADLSEEERNMALSTIFGSDAMRAAAGVIDAGSQSMLTAAEISERLGVSIEDATAMIEDGWTNFDILKESMSNTDAIESAATRMDTLAGAGEVLEGIVESVGTKLGTALLPAVRTVVDNLIVLADEVGPSVVAFFESVADVIVGFANNLNEGMSPLNAFIEAIWDIAPQQVLDNLVMLRDEILPELLSEFERIVQPIIDFVARNVELNDVLIALGLTLAAVIIPSLISIAATIGAVLLPFIALVAIVAALRAAWENNFLGIQDKTAEAWAAIQPLLQQAQEWLQVNVPVAIAFLRDKFAEYWPTIQSAVETAWQVISTVFNALVIFVSEVLIPGIQAYVTQWLESFQTTSNFLQNWWTIVSTIFGEVVRWIRVNIMPFVRLLAQSWRTSFQLIREQVQIAWSFILPIFTTIQDWLENVLTAAVEFVRETFDDEINAIIALFNSFKQTIDNVKQAAIDLWNWITSHTFSFNFSIPDLPDWLIPGSPTPLEMSWRSLERFARSMTLAPRAAVARDALVAGSPAAFNQQRESAAAGDTYNITVDARNAENPPAVRRAVRDAMRDLGIQAQLVSQTR